MSRIVTTTTRTDGTKVSYDELRLVRELEFRLTCQPSDNPVDRAVQFEEFCKKFVKIATPFGPRPFLLRPAQRSTVISLCNGEDIVVLKSRQIGFSTLFAVWTLWNALIEESFEALFLSRNEREAVYLLRKAKFSYARLPDWLRERLPRIVDRNQTKMSFDNDSSIESLPSKKDAARGRTTRLMIADEFAFLEDQEEAWSSMEPATDVGGQVVVLSTANGSGDLFETLWNKASTKAMEYTPLFFAWWEDGTRDRAWYENKARTMLPWQLAQEYPANAEEAFVRSGNAVFDIDRLRAMDPVSPIEGTIDQGHFRVAKGGPLAVWETPIPGAVYVIGVDIAEGLEHGDRSVAVVLDFPAGNIVARYVGRPVPHEFAQEVVYLANWYNTALIGPERNNHGHAFIRELVRLKYQKIFQRKSMERRQVKETDVLGWLTTAPSKAYIIDGLYKWSMEHRVQDEVIRKEMMTYVRDEKGRMGGSPFDDSVMAAAIAVEMLNHATEPQYQTRKVVKPWTFDWLARRYDRIDQENQWRRDHMHVT